MLVSKHSYRQKHRFTIRLPDVTTPVIAIHCFFAGAAGFPGGGPAGMPGLGDLLKDPELLNAMKVMYCFTEIYIPPVPLLHPMSKGIKIIHSLAGSWMRIFSCLHENKKLQQGDSLPLMHPLMFKWG